MDINEKLFNHYKEAYHFELGRKDQITSNLNLPLTVLTLVGALLAYYLENLPSGIPNYLTYLIIVLIVASILCMCSSIYFLYRCLFGYTYGYVSNTQMIAEHVKALRIYNEFVAEDKRLDIDKELEALLSEQYSICATENWYNNKRKLGYLGSATKSLLFTVIALAITSVPFVVLKFVPEVSNKPRQSEAQNLMESDMSKKQEQPQATPQDSSRLQQERPEFKQQDSTQSKPAVPPQAMKKPAKPGIVWLKESQEKKVGTQAPAAQTPKG